MTRTKAPKGSGDFFALGVLPWLVAAAALATYLVTLNPWLRLSSLPWVARTAGWDWHPAVLQPVLFLAALPLRWAPAAWLPVALNGFTAVCAAATLALLARSVALLPHDRLPAERLLEGNEHSLLSLRTAWAPPLLAVAVCGLGFTFWENATVASGAMVDLLLFAYVIRCLLEFRIDEHQRWLSRAAFVAGVGMANDWAMLAFFPLLVVALIWIKGLAFFKPAFLGRMAVYGLAGLSLIFLLPVVQAFSPDSPVGFWTCVGEALSTPFKIVWALASRFYNTNRAVMLLLGIVSLLPVLVMSIRWRSITADSSPVGSFLSKAIFHFSYLLLLADGLWVAMDPPFSPRQIGARAGIGYPCLTLYYLSALSVGYFSGYVLLMLSAKTPEFRRRENGLAPLGRGLGRGAAWLVFLLLPACLWVKNLPMVRTANLPLLRDYAQLSLQSLPCGGTVVLSDDPARLYLVQGALADRGGAAGYAFVDTGSLPHPAYQARLHRLYPKLWPEKPANVRTNQMLEPIQLLSQLDRLSRSNALHYLHPSFGYYFERFYPIQAGLTFELHRYPDQALNVPVATPAEIEANQTFWRTTAAGPMRQAIKTGFGASEDRANWRTIVLKKFKAKTEPPVEALQVDNWYGTAADCWGVRLQRNGRLADAARCFSLAKELFPANRAAELNLACNQWLAGAQPAAMDFSVPLEEKLGAYRYVDQMMTFNGPVDDPSLCYALGILFARNGEPHQAVQQLDRVNTLLPTFLGPRLVLGALYSEWGMPKPLMRLVTQIRSTPELQPTNRAERIDVDFLEASAQLLNTNEVRAHALIQARLDESPNDPDLLRRAVVFYASAQRYTNAFALVDRRLRLAPDDLVALGAKGYLCLQTGAFSNALPPLNRVLTLQATNVEALLNRAVTQVRLGDFAPAEADYQALLKLGFPRLRVYFSLAEIAYLKKDTNAAIRYYQGCLSNSTPEMPETQFAQARLKELRAPPR